MISSSELHTQSLPMRTGILLSQLDVFILFSEYTSEKSKSMNHLRISNVRFKNWENLLKLRKRIDSGVRKLEKCFIGDQSDPSWNMIYIDEWNLVLSWKSYSFEVLTLGGNMWLQEENNIQKTVHRYYPMAEEYSFSLSSVIGKYPGTDKRKAMEGNYKFCRSEPDPIARETHSTRRWVIGISGLIWWAEIFRAEQGSRGIYKLQEFSNGVFPVPTSLPSLCSCPQSSVIATIFHGASTDVCVVSHALVGVSRCCGRRGRRWIP